MSELASADHRDPLRHGARPRRAAGEPRAVPVLAAALLVAAAAVLALDVVAFLGAGDHVPGVIRPVLFAAAAAGVVVLVTAAGMARAATTATGRTRRRLLALRAASASGLADLQLLADKVRQGERPALRDPGPVAAGARDLFALLAHDLQRERHAALRAIVQTAAYGPAGSPDNRVEVFVNLARRMQSLLHREIQALDQVEGRVEDPELLTGLFTVDHFATRMRRYTESLAVLGGAVSRRHWSRPVPVHEVLRAATAEVEHYARVKIVPPVPGTLQPGAVADVIHLIAELIDNATKFSPPGARALLRTGEVTAGLAIEVEDRGLGMDPAEQQRMNGVLADPEGYEISDLISDGRIGLYVVSVLARRHGIVVQLQRNIFGGTQAVVVLPPRLVDTGSQLDTGSELRGPSVARTPAGPAVSAVSAPAEAVATGRRPALPSRTGRALAPTYPAESPDGAGGRPAPAPLTTPGHADVPVQQADPGDRPPLPRRGTMSHMAPQLRQGPGPAVPDEPATDNIPGLMAAFQGGVRRAEEEGDSRNGGRGSR